MLEMTDTGTTGDVLRFFHEEGLSCRQISKILSVNAGRVLRRLRRAVCAGISWSLPSDVALEALTGSLFPFEARFGLAG